MRTGDCIHTPTALDPAGETRGAWLVVAEPGTPWPSELTAQLSAATHVAFVSAPLEVSTGEVAARVAAAARKEAGPLRLTVLATERAHELRAALRKAGVYGRLLVQQEPRSERRLRAAVAQLRAAVAAE